MLNNKWKIFERLVAAIHIAQQKGAIIHWNEKINGRQFDVTIRFKHGLYEYLTVVECKDYSKPVSAEKVDALVTKSGDAHADKAIMVAASGFQQGAIAVAQRHNVGLFSLKTLGNTEEGKISDSFMPVLSIYAFRFEREGKKPLGIPEEPGVLKLFMRNTIIEGPEVNTTPEGVLDRFRAEIHKSANNIPQELRVEFPKGTVMIHQNTGHRELITRFSFRFRIITAGDLKTTEGLGVDKYLDGSVYKLENELTKEGQLIDSTELKLGFDTVLESGKFYSEPNLRFSYFCETVSDTDATMYLIESYQGGQFIQATIVTPKDWWWQFVEVTDKEEIQRLMKLYHEYIKD